MGLGKTPGHDMNERLKSLSLLPENVPNEHPLLHFITEIDIF